MNSLKFNSNIEIKFNAKTRVYDVYMLVQIHTDQGTQKWKKSKAKAEGCQCPQYSLNGL